MTVSLKTLAKMFYFTGLSSDELEIVKQYIFARVFSETVISFVPS